MITLLFAMGAQGWVPLPFCCASADRFIEASGISLEILILVGKYFYYRHQVLVGGGNLGVFWPLVDLTLIFCCWWWRIRCRSILQ